MQLKWFARLYMPWKNWKDRVLAQVRNSRPWRTAHRIKLQVKASLKVGWIRVRAALLAAGL